MIWFNQRKDKHFWTFYYYCKRQGDDVKVVHLSKDRADLIVLPSK